MKEKVHLLAPPPIFDGLLGHGGPDNDDQRQNSADGAVRSQGCEGQAAGDQEIDVGDSPELLKQRFRNEGDQCILGRRNIVGCIIEILGLEAIGIVGEGDPREPGPSDVRMGLIKMWLCAGKAEQSADMELLPPSSTHLMDN